ncbi:hypothetical protein ONZ45_g5000 [Pleurotus djamor]|nr:hypothetical protein ONZ45_g5000 [Pleurotus djamor]
MQHPVRTLNNSDAHTVIAPDLISEFESYFWYHGISGDPPKLLWRSDLETNPFSIPAPETHFIKIPIKSIHGVFGTRLNAVWCYVAPQILDLLKDRAIRYSSLTTARFAIVEDGKEEKERFGPIVVWIGVPPNSASVTTLGDATPAILRIHNDAQVTDVVVEWYEEVVQKPVGRPLEHQTGSCT